MWARPTSYTPWRNTTQVRLLPGFWTMCMLRGTQIQQVKHSEEALWRKVDDGIINTEETVRSHNEKYSPQIRKHKE